MKREMCIYLPDWPLQRLWHAQPGLRDKPLVIVREKGGQTTRANRVILCCPLAARAGVRHGMTAAEAKAVKLPSPLVVRAEDIASDVQALRRLAEWTERYSPIVGLEESHDSLLVDITGCADCFHGEERLGQQALAALTEQGWHARIAIADTYGAAWGLAHFMNGSQHFACIPPSATTDAVLPLPIAALRLPPETVATLAALGIERIGQLAELPRDDVADRFGALVTRRLDQALGRVEEAIVPHRAVPEVEASCSFAYPIERRQLLHVALDKLLVRIEEMLRARGGGGHCLECWLYHESAAPCRLEVRLSRPGRSARHLGVLLRVELERVVLAEPVIGVRVRIPVVETIAEHQIDLFNEGTSYIDALPTLIDSLSSRLGRDAVTFATLVPDPQPEFACRYEPAVRAPVRASVRAAPVRAATVRERSPVERHLAPLPDGRGSDLRPVQLLAAPVPLDVMTILANPPLRVRWSGMEHAVRRCWGPERIETGWWRGQDIHRDYYIIETEGGARLWIFRRLEDGRWFLHGCFD